MNEIIAMDSESLDKSDAARQEIAPIIRQDFTTDNIVLALSRPGRPDRLVLGAGVILIDEFAPHVQALMDRAADGAVLTEGEETLLFNGLHVLGAARYEAAFKSLLALLRRPEDELARYLGDALTETLPRIAIGLFNCDTKALFDAIADPAVDQFIRHGLIGAAAFLTWQGRIMLSSMTQFLENFDDAGLAADGNVVWDGWAHAAALLGLRALAPRVQQAMASGRVDARITDWTIFSKDLEHAESEPQDSARFTDAGYGYIEDIATVLDWVHYPEDEVPTTTSSRAHRAFDKAPEFQQPYVNPMRHVGRNDPCPCGSGKKYKKCCIDR